MGFELTGIELDPEYYSAAKERLMKQQSVPQLFAAEDLVDYTQESSGYLF
ncbi:methyltransferase [Porphyromonas phage phage005b_ATCC49417]|uniref:Methyltransferase n=2 Tax=root TaxID=1 RepID=A0AAT9J7Z0_9VIRU